MTATTTNKPQMEARSYCPLQQAEQVQIASPAAPNRKQTRRLDPLRTIPTTMSRFANQLIMHLVS